MSTLVAERLAVEVAGEGTPVLLLHGLGGTSNTWTPQMGILGGHRVVRPDLPGSGRSPLGGGALTIAALVEKVEALARTLGIERAVVVAHSMGTIVAQHLALRAPRLVGALAFCGALIAPPDQARAALKARAAKARAEGMAEIADQIVAAATSSHTKQGNPVAVALVREMIMRQDPAGYAANCEALAAAEAADATRIACPTLLLTGEDDAVAPPSVTRTLAERIRGARAQILPRCGHWTTFEAAEAVNGQLREFLMARR